MHQPLLGQFILLYFGSTELLVQLRLCPPALITATVYLPNKSTLSGRLVNLVKELLHALTHGLDLLLELGLLLLSKLLLSLQLLLRSLFLLCATGSSSLLVPLLLGPNLSLCRKLYVKRLVNPREHLLSSGGLASLIKRIEPVRLLNRPYCSIRYALGHLSLAHLGQLVLVNALNRRVDGRLVLCLRDSSPTRDASRVLSKGGVHSLVRGGRPPSPVPNPVVQNVLHRLLRDFCVGVQLVHLLGQLLDSTRNLLVQGFIKGAYVLTDCRNRVRFYLIKACDLRGTIPSKPEVELHRVDGWHVSNTEHVTNEPLLALANPVHLGQNLLKLGQVPLCFVNGSGKLNDVGQVELASLLRLLAVFKPSLLLVPKYAIESEVILPVRLADCLKLVKRLLVNDALLNVVQGPLPKRGSKPPSGQLLRSNLSVLLEQRDAVRAGLPRQASSSDVLLKGVLVPEIRANGALRHYVRLGHVSNRHLARNQLFALGHDDLSNVVQVLRELCEKIQSTLYGGVLGI